MLNFMVTVYLFTYPDSRTFSISWRSCLFNARCRCSPFIGSSVGTRSWLRKLLYILYRRFFFYYTLLYRQLCTTACVFFFPSYFQYEQHSASNYYLHCFVFLSKNYHWRMCIHQINYSTLGLTALTQNVPWLKITTFWLLQIAGHPWLITLHSIISSGIFNYPFVGHILKT